MSNGIPWCDVTWNPITGCGQGLACWPRCWARQMAERLKRMGKQSYQHDDPFAVRCHEDQLDKPVHWHKPRVIFTCSMGDWMHDDVPDHAIVAVLDVMSSETQHQFLALTKRPERFARIEAFGTMARFTDNLWLGVSVMGPQDAHRVATLCETPAAHRWVNVGPFVEGPIDLTPWLGGGKCTCTDDAIPWHSLDCPASYNRLEWVCIEAESGPDRRVMKWAWLADLLRQCREAGVPAFVKQVCMPQTVKAPWLPKLGPDAMDNLCAIHGTRVSHNPAEWPEWARVRQWPEDIRAKHGKDGEA